MVGQVHAVNAEAVLQCPDEGAQVIAGPNRPWSNTTAGPSPLRLW